MIIRRKIIWVGVISSDFGEIEAGSPFVCFPKVADRGEPGDFVRFPVTDKADDRGAPPSDAAEQATAFAGYIRSGEMTAMVSAMTRVISGDTGTASLGGGTTSFGVSGSWAGVKREREEESVSNQFTEQPQRVYRGYSSNFRGAHGESSSSAGGLFSLFTQFFSPFYMTQ